MGGDAARYAVSGGCVLEGTVSYTNFLSFHPEKCATPLLAAAIVIQFPACVFISVLTPVLRTY